MACAIKVDGTWDGIFRLQDRIVRELIGALRLTVDTSEKRGLTRLQTGYVEAYEKYSKGRNKFQGMGKGTLDEARVYFARALALESCLRDGAFGTGCHPRYAFCPPERPECDLLLAKNHLEMACQLDRELAEPYPWLCCIYMLEGKLQEALVAGDRAD